MGEKENAINSSESLSPTAFTTYQVWLIVLFGFLLFTIVADYMTLPALSAILLPELQITTQQFGLLVSVYAFSAGASGFLATGFADRFDRKKLLLVYYGGFLLGMLLCATATSWLHLLIARIVTGTFGGVVASICFAIVSDLFTVDQRGRVMGFIQMAFAASQVAGLPLALFLATHYNWHLTYWVFFILGVILLSILFFVIRPVDTHLEIKADTNLLKHSLKVVSHNQYGLVFINNALLVLADVMFMTFSSAYSTNNLGVDVNDLPLLFGIGGAATLVLGPVLGRLTDQYGKWNIFKWGTVLAMITVGIYSHIGQVPFWLVVLLHTLLFVGINARMIASTALATVVPDQADRGAFMALDASFQQIAGGVAAAAAGLIVFQASDGLILRYPLLGFVVIGVMFITMGLMYRINRWVNKRK